MPRGPVQRAFRVALLFVGCLCAAQSPSPPPRPSSPPPPRPSPRPPTPPSPVAPYQLISLFAIENMTQWALCSQITSTGCLGGNLQWVIDLPPFPLTTGASSSTSGLSCIGNSETGCKWRTIQEYQSALGPDTKVYIPLGLTIQAESINQMFQLGHAIWTVNQVSTWASYIFRQLQTLSISCSNPVPVFAPYILEPLIMALSGAGMDFGWNTTATVSAASASRPPPPPQSNSTSGGAGGGTASVNTTSDATRAAAPWTYSRLYSQPAGGPSLLRSLSIQDCSLTGQLPPASFWLQLPALERLDLSRNQLSGALPGTFGPSPPLSYMNLSHNRLTGPLTASLARYGGCGRILDLSYNDLRGEVPDAWLSSACSLQGKSSLGPALWRRRRRRQLQELQESGPDGGMMKVLPSLLSYRVASPLAAVTESTAPSSTSSTATTGATSATPSNSYAYWLSYSTSYMYGGDSCPLFGIAWSKTMAARVRNVTGNATGTVAPPFNFTVLLYGNPHLETPGGSGVGYAVGSGRYVEFRIRENACTVFNPFSELLWLWGTFSGMAIAMLLVALGHALFTLRQARVRVVPAASAGAGSGAGDPRKRVAQHPRERLGAAEPTPLKGSGGGGGGGGGDAAPMVPPAAPPISVIASSDTSGGDAGGRVSGGTESAGVWKDAGVVPENQFALIGFRGEHSNGGGGGGGGGGSYSGGGQMHDLTTTSRSPEPPVTAMATASGGSSDGGAGMARLIIVSHVQRHCARAVLRLSVYGNALIGGLGAFIAWVLYDIPWGVLIRSVVAIAVHLSAAGLTYAMSRPERRGYCHVRQCGSYLYLVPPLLSVSSIGLTVFLMSATRALAGSMASRVATVKPGPGGSADGSLNNFDAGKSPVKDGDAGSTNGAQRVGLNGEEAVGRSRSSGTSSPPHSPAAGEQSGPWVNGLQPRRGGPSPPGSAESQQAALVAIPGSLAVYDASALPVPARMGGRHVGSSNGSTRVTPSGSPRATSRRPVAEAVLGGRGGGGGGGGYPRIPVRGPVAESFDHLQAGGGGVGPTPAGPAVEGQQRHSRWGIGSWLHLKPADEKPPTSSARPLLPASPYNLKNQQHVANGHEVAVGARAEASLQNSFALPLPESCRGGFGSDCGSLHDAYIQACGGPRNGTAPAALGPGGHTGATSAQGPVAEAADNRLGEIKEDGGRSIVEANAASGGGGDSRSSLPPRDARGNGRQVAAESGGGERSSGGSTRCNPQTTSSTRRASRRPSPISAVGGTSTLGSPTANSSSSALSPGSVSGPRTDGGFGETESSSPPYSTVDSKRGQRSLAQSSSTSTRGSRHLRVVVEPSTAGWCPETSLMKMSSPTSAQQTPAFVLPHSPRVPDSPAQSGASKRGGPWLEDRLAALATLSASGVAPASTATVGARMPSVAAAAAVAAETPRRHGGGGDADGGILGKNGSTPHVGGATGGCSVPKLHPEALSVVNQYLRDYAFGKKGSGWAARTGHTLRSILIVLLIYSPLAPLVAAAALLAAVFIIAGSLGGNSARQLTAPLRLSGNLMLSLHTHVAAWVMCLPLAVFTGVLYGLGYMWGKYAVPYPFVWIACNASCLASVMLLLFELAFQMPVWEQGVCRYPYRVVCCDASAAAGQ